MKYKYSKFNVCVMDDKVFLIFNTMSQSLLEVEKDDYENFKNENVVALDNLDNETLKLLEDLGFIVKDNLSEISLLKDYYWYNKYNDETLNISILTTLDCNFRCPYCFETRRNVKLNDDIQEAIIKFIRKKIVGKKLLHVDWYGGEPLLNKKVILDLSKQFENICKKNKVEYFGTITTNGLLLTEKISKELKDVGVKSAQVTIDSNRESHNKTRILADGSPTYDIILKNIKASSKYLTIFVRSNVSEETMDQMDGLLKDLKGIDNVKLSIKGIVPASYKLYNKKLLSPKKFSDKVLNKYFIAEKMNIKTAIDSFLNNEFHRFCIVDSDSQYIISPDGKIVKCGESYTDNDLGIIGQYNDETKELEIDENKKIFWDKDPFSYNECLNCKALPLCYGGCQMKRKVKKEEACSPELKYNLDKLILYLYYKSNKGEENV